MRTRLNVALMTLSLVLGARSSFAHAQTAPIRPDIPAGTVPDEIPGVGVDEQFARAIPRDAAFVDHEGRPVRIGDLLDGERPVLLTLVYHQCASFCDMALRSVANALQTQPWTVGVEFDVVTLSIDPRDTPEVLAAARSRILGRYGREEAARGWHFLGGSEDEIRRVAAAVGYRYFWDERTQQFAHPGAMVVLQPSGMPSRYLYGLEYSFNDVRLALAEASEGRHLATSERVLRAALLYCFRWDHSDGRYVLAAWRIMRAGGVITALALGGALFSFWRRERRRGAAAAAGTSITTDETGASARPRES